MYNNDLTVHLDKKPIYNIIYRASFDDLADEITKLGYSDRRICIVSETNVASLYMDAILLSLSKSCKMVTSFVFPEGEQSKNLDVVKKLYEKLILDKFDRSDVLIALGGGVVGDLTGYTAATYLRGIDFIQIPTSLLAQVDSCIGGKTGVDFDSYKNMVGAFHMPKLVYMNLSVLSTLPKRQLVSGMGEIIKHGLIKNEEYYVWLKEHKDDILSGDFEARMKLVRESNIVKRDVVENDPTEKGERALLNLGHTLGHAIEKYMNFSMYHGECVLIGCILSAIISKNRGYISEAVLSDIINTIGLYFDYKDCCLPEDASIDKIIEYTKNDKKVVGDKIKFVVLHGIGKSAVDTDITTADMKHAISEYMKLIREN